MAKDIAERLIIEVLMTRYFVRCDAMGLAPLLAEMRHLYTTNISFYATPHYLK